MRKHPPSARERGSPEERRWTTAFPSPTIGGANTLHHDTLPSRRAQRGPAHPSGSRSKHSIRHSTSGSGKAELLTGSNRCSRRRAPPLQVQGPARDNRLPIASSFTAPACSTSPGRPHFRCHVTPLTSIRDMYSLHRACSSPMCAFRPARRSSAAPTCPSSAGPPQRRMTSTPSREWLASTSAEEAEANATDRRTVGTGACHNQPCAPQHNTRCHDQHP